MADTSSNDDGMRVDVLRSLVPGEVIVRVTHEPTGITETEAVTGPFTPVMRALKAKVQTKLRNRGGAAG